MTRTAALPGAPFRTAIAAFLIWAAHLVSLYAVGGVVCAAGARGDLERLFAVGATVVALLGAAVLLVRVLGLPHGDRGMIGFGRDLAAASCVLAMIAVLWQALPAMLIPACT